MRDFINPNAKLKLRIPPYHKMHYEERAYVIQNLYRQAKLNKSDVGNYLLWGAIEPFGWGLPLLLMISPALSAGRGFAIRRRNLNELTVLGYGALAWLGFAIPWHYYNPFTSKYRYEQTKLMDWIDVNLGDFVFRYNKLLPRWWYEPVINFHTISMMIKRDWYGYGVFAPPLAHADLIIDPETTAENEDYI